MKKIEFKSQVLPHIIAVLIFALVSIIYFKPVFLEHKALNQHDIKQWEGGAKEVLDYRRQTGEEALWTDSMFGGMPAYQISTQWGIGIMSGFQAAISLGLPHPVKVIFLSFLSFYILLSVYGVRPYLAIAGALAYGLTSLNIIGFSAGHNARIMAIAYMPLVLAGVRATFTKNKLLGFTLTGLGLALELSANHLQITYYLVFIVLAYLIAELVIAIKAKKLKTFFSNAGILAAAAVLALATFIGSFISTMEYAKYTMRGPAELTSSDGKVDDGLEKDYAFQYSNGIFEPTTLLIPNVLGGSSGQQLDIDSNVGQFMLNNGVPPAQVEQQIQAMPTYWGDQPNTAPYYAGAIVCFLFILGLLTADRTTVIWVAAIAVLGIVLSWGSSFSSLNYFLFDYLPGYNKFRSVTFALTLTIFAFNLLGSLGLEQLLKNGWSPQSKKRLLLAFGLTGGIALLLAIFAGALSFRGAVDAQLPDWLIEPLRADRKSLLVGDAMRSFFFILVAMLAIAAWLRKMIKPGMAMSLLILLVLLDLWIIDKRYLNETNFVRNPRRTFFNITEADSEILRDKDPSYRVFNLNNPFNEARTSYYHKSIGGYHGAKLRRYQDVISNCLTTELSGIINQLQNNSIILPPTPILNMLNTKYFVAGAAKETVLRNASANGSAWFIQQIQPVASPDEELQQLCQLNTKATGLVDESKFTVSQTRFNNSGVINLDHYKPNKLVYQSESDAEGFAVFSEIYYPHGWVARIDGEETPILRTNYILRGLYIPAGQHTIEFSFEPKIYSYGNMITTTSTLLLMLLVIGTILIELEVIRTKKLA